jgi:hypothetical protein
VKYKKGTFVVVPNLDELKGKPSEMQAIYLWICQHADSDGMCFPKKATLSREAGCSHNTVDKYLKQLVKDEFLEIKQRKTKEGKNTSNEYQLLILGRGDVNSGSGIPPNNGSQTISNINSTHLTTITEDIKEDKVTLPLVRADGVSTGKTPADRLLYLYSKLYYSTYHSSYKPNWGRDKKILADMLSSYSEVQVAYMLCVYFTWHGMTGSDSREFDFVTGATFPITMFKTTCNKYEVYIRNVLGFKFDDDNEMLNKVGEHLRGLN